MAKLKLAKKEKTAAKSNARAIPCVIIVLGAIVLLAMLFYAILQSSNE